MDSNLTLKGSLGTLHGLSQRVPESHRRNYFRIVQKAQWHGHLVLSNISVPLQLEPADESISLSGLENLQDRRTSLRESFVESGANYGRLRIASAHKCPKGSRTNPAIGSHNKLYENVAFHSGFASCIRICRYSEERFLGRNSIYRQTLLLFKQCIAY